MKKKRYEGKLTLNKVTLTNLDQSKLNKVKGGYRTIEKYCAIYSLSDACTWAPVCEGTYWC